MLVVEPGKHPYVAAIENRMQALQRAVGGWIEVISLDEESLIIGNDESKLLGLPGNRQLENDILAGTFLIVGRQGDAFTSLSEENQVYYANVFWEPEEITPEEVQETMRCDVIFLK